MTEIQIHQGDSLEIMRSLPDSSVDLILTDPPYFRVVDEPWDHQWDNASGFLAWLGVITAEAHRILAPNGSLYLFASPRMAARIEVQIAQRLNVLNHIVWAKPTSRAGQAEKEVLRSYFPESERIIFAEHYGSDNIAKGEAGYDLQCDKLRGFVFEPLRVYLDSERARAGVKQSQIMAWMEANGYPKYVVARHSFSQSQWELPTEDNYHALRRCLSELNHQGEDLRRDYEYLRRDYEDLRRDYEDLRRDYEDLRRDYEDLRRPFYATAHRPYTDVWHYKPVQPGPDRHPCEKPPAMIEHIIKTSSRPGGMVADFFLGSGATAVAAQKLGRSFIGCDISAKWVDHTRRRLGAAYQMDLLDEAIA